MRSRDILVFFSVVFIIYAGANTLIYFKGAHALDGIFNQTVYTLLFILFAATFISGKIMERFSSSPFIDFLNIAGGFWLAFMLYSVLLLVFSDLLLLLNSATGVVSITNPESFRQTVYLIAFSSSALLIAIGFLNTAFPAVKEYNILIRKYFPEKELIIAAVSDIHLGSIIRKRSMRILSDKLESVSPDIILLLGDIVDGEINPVIRDDLLESLRIPKGTVHTVAITGNHEFIGGISKTIPYIESKGIRVLLDEVIGLENYLQIIGRIDRDSERYTGSRRTDLNTLLDKTDPSRPVIVLDHQPPLKNDRIDDRVDLILSGHTHNGQMWPLNYLTSAIYKIKYGHKLIDGVHFIVSSGYGSWGPRVRLGSRPEILKIKLNFKDS